MIKKLFLTIALILFSNVAWSATYYVRTDGGTTSQCDGTHDAPLAGAVDSGDTGTLPDCALSHPAWVIGAVGTNPLMIGSDTLIVGPGQYMIGIGMPNTVGCSYFSPQNCVLDDIPSGTTTNPTRILGKEWDTGCGTMSQLWGTDGAIRIFHLTNKANVEMQCLEMTDHASCGLRTGVQCTDYNTANGTTIGPWGSRGLVGTNVTNFKGWNIDIHGFAVQGVLMGNLNGITDLKNFKTNGNYNAGWEGDDRQLGGDGSLNKGTFRAHKMQVKFNGCREAYPRSASFNPADYSDCTGNENSGGYGEGMGSYNTTGTFIFTYPDFSNNTSDGLDLLYGSNTMDLYIDKGVFEGNAGNQLKYTARNFEVTNTAIIGNCSYHSKSGKVYGPGAGSFSNCRAGGVPLSVTTVLGSNWKFRNVSLVGADDSDGSAFLEIENRNGSCNGSEVYDFKNLIGYSQVPGFWGSGYGFYNTSLSGACLTAWDARSVTYSKLYNWPANHPGTGNTYTAPAWAGSINNAIASNLANIVLTSNVGGGTAASFWNTATDLNNFPQNGSIDQGAYQYGTDSSYQLAAGGQACVADTDCANNDCVNFFCSGSCTTNGGACGSGNDCCSAYCNGSSVCATPTTCGDGTVQPGEVCDGSNLNGSNCIQQGFTGGTLACNSDCLSFNTSSCNNTVVFPLTPVLDNFNRANGAIGSNWNVYTGGFNVASNAITPSGGSGSDNIAIWGLATFASDQEVYTTIANKGSNSDKVVLYIRGNLSALNAYLLLVDPAAGQSYVYRLDAGSIFQLGATISGTINSGDSIGMSIVGSTITVYHKPAAGSWTPLTTRSDSTHTSGGNIGVGSPVGIGIADIVLENFGGGSLNPITCGNGVKEGAEVCDGADLGGQSCTTQGFGGGTLSCASNCASFVTSSCTSPSTCGNNTKEINELCDGTDLDSVTCTSLGYAGGGTLSCASNCQSFVTTACIAGGSGVRGGVIIK